MSELNTLKPWRRSQAGSGSSLVAALELNRKAYGFEIKKQFHRDATKWINEVIQAKKDIAEFGFDKTRLEKTAPTLWTT